VAVVEIIWLFLVVVDDTIFCGLVVAAAVAVVESTIT